MTDFLDKLLNCRENKYALTKAAMNAINKIGNMKDYPEESEKGKVVSNILHMIFEEKVKYQVLEEDEKLPQEES